MGAYDTAMEKLRTSRSKKVKSTWDDDVTPEFLDSLTPQEKAVLFPNEYNSDGQPYGDF